ncbi:hypothetical protein [Pontibacter sp. SGAir0037]|uniref:hypothetical protein n=1 Tax=Pontibacter sp. SGAir0037 TaxID=2571030 RepID=UPI0010CD48CD|nr:hypothetical protein [Pontibacter sp. SGAir0037]QCR21949.1 hypothetical protein C1N53_06105 [Pontibacter sp. SGAir0037]
MAALSADELNSAFLKNFFSETIFILPDEAAPALYQSQEQMAETNLRPVASPETPPPAVAPAAPQEVPHSAPTPHKPIALPKMPKIEPVLPGSFEVIGENKKGVVVLVTLPDQEFKALPQSEFLRKILGAIGFQPADVAFVNNISGTIANFEELVTKLQVNYIISFASRLHTDKPHDKFTLYNPVKVAEVPIVFSQSLAVLDKNQEQKKFLWNALQKVFK